MSEHTPDSGRALLRRLGSQQPFHRGDRLITAGTRSDEVLLIEFGLVKVVLPGVDGCDRIVGLYGGGDLIGEIGVAYGEARSAHVVALRDGAAVHIAGTHFLQLRRNYAEIDRLIDHTWHKRQLNTDSQQVAQTLEVPLRIRLCLLEWARTFGEPEGNGRRMNDVTQQDVAQAVAASLQSVQEVFRELRDAGHLTTQRRSYTIVDLRSFEGSLPAHR